MIGTTHTTRLLTTGLALAATCATLAAPAAFAARPVGYGPPDRWALPYLKSTAKASHPLLTDTTDSARVARGKARQPQGSLSRGFLTDTTDSARVARGA